MSKALVFRQVTALGELRLAVPALGAQPRDALGAALALASCEGLLHALEAWLGCELDPAPMEGDTAVSTEGVQAAVNAPALAPAGTTLFMSWQELQAHGQPPECLRGDALAWTALQFEVELARYEQAPLPPDALRAGGVLLLPESFRAPWPVRLLHHGLGIDWPATWCGPGGEFALDAAPRALLSRTDAPDSPDSSDAAREWRVVLDARLPIDVARRLAGDVSAVQLAGEAGSHALLLVPHGDLPIARGRVAPALQGAALWLPLQPDPLSGAALGLDLGATASAANSVRTEPAEVPASPAPVRTEPVEVPASWT
ncbi:hypothetical protein BURC_00958 [Burkholderiaceae bacterium]|nr:hypothetical protein BURC_00958 [Burkholderiaceae bacterium]